MYKILFIHRAFPGQFEHIAAALARMPGVQVDALASEPASIIDGVKVHVYATDSDNAIVTHSYLQRTDAAVRRGQAVLAACTLLSNNGYRPDLVIGHQGWGEVMYVKDLWPTVPLLGYFEYYYHGTGGDIGFDPPLPVSLYDLARVRTLNMVNLLGLEAADRGVTPTRWQHDLHPEAYRSKLFQIHEGIDTLRASPAEATPMALPDGYTVMPGHEIVTYVARDLEHYRGFHMMMRAAVHFLRARPQAHLVIAGRDQVSYGPPPPQGGSWREVMLAELAGLLPLDRVHFTGTLSHSDFINLMRHSTAHIYLSYPFVLSWSMLEAMACGVCLVASATAPVMEVVQHGHDGLLVPFHDPAAIAAGVVTALDMSPPARERMRHAARQTVLNRYDLQTIALPQWLDMLHREFGLPLA